VPFIREACEAADARLEVSFPPIPLADCGGSLLSANCSRLLRYSKGNTNGASRLAHTSHIGSVRPTEHWSPREDVRPNAKWELIYTPCPDTEHSAGGAAQRGAASDGRPGAVANRYACMACRPSRLCTSVLKFGTSTTRTSLRNCRRNASMRRPSPRPSAS